MVPTEQQPFPSSQEDHLSPSETRRTGSGSLHWPTLPKKAALGRKAKVLMWWFFFLFLFWLLQFASASAVSHPPHQLSHPWLLSQPTFWGGAGWPGTNEWPSVQQQLGLMVWETGRSCQHLINRTHPALMTHKTWREVSQEEAFRHPL